MKSGRSLGQNGRFARVEPVIRRTFDIPTMARLSVGSSWTTLSEGQQKQVIESFGRYISAIYADRFDSYAGQKLQVTAEQPAAAGLIVKSRIIKATGEPVSVDYMMRRNGDTWLISDIRKLFLELTRGPKLRSCEHMSRRPDREFEPVSPQR